MVFDFIILSYFSLEAKELGLGWGFGGVGDGGERFGGVGTVVDEADGVEEYAGEDAQLAEAHGGVHGWDADVAPCHLHRLQEFGAEVVDIVEGDGVLVGVVEVLQYHFGEAVDLGGTEGKVGECGAEVLVARLCSYAKCGELTDEEGDVGKVDAMGLEHFELCTLTTDVGRR